MKNIELITNEQKNNECLPECLLSVCKYFEIDITLEDIIASVSTNSDKLYDWEFKAGTLIQEKGFKSTIYTNVGHLFDPSWNNLSNEELLEKIEEESKYFSELVDLIDNEPKQNNFIFPNDLIIKRYKKEADALHIYLTSGGKISFEPISEKLIKSYIDKKSPVIVSINPTLLHNITRAYNNKPDDIRGIIWGHVIIISGYDEENFLLNDPGGDFYTGSRIYTKRIDKVIESILRYNGQMLVIEK